MRPQLALALMLLLTLAVGRSARAADRPESPESDAAARELASVQGKWRRTVKTDRGTLEVVKQHVGNKTTLTIRDAQQRVLTAKSSEFRLQMTDKVRLFTFFNNRITAGPNKGQLDKSEKSYIYRVSGDTFFEVNGLLVDDEEPPLTHVWTRVKD